MRFLIWLEARNCAEAAELNGVEDLAVLQEIHD
jgi:hypothetical protein